jgi:hypothetical protein
MGLLYVVVSSGTLSVSNGLLFQSSALPTLIFLLEVSTFKVEVSTLGFISTERFDYHLVCSGKISALFLFLM